MLLLVSLPGKSLAGVTADLAAGKIPLYPGAKPHPTGNRGHGTVAIATLEARLPEVVAFYRRELPKRGWRETVAGDILNQDLDKVPLALLLYEQGKQQLRIVVTGPSANNRKTTVWIAREEASHGQSAR
ncbi:MAG TPA: hypothetical protein V6D05_12045 [Stenomitos sp.]